MKIPQITEAEFTSQVLALAKLHGWRSLHIRPGRTKTGWRTSVQGDGVGFSDLLLLRGRVQIVAELKRSAVQKPTAEQILWLEAFSKINDMRVFVWDPSDWPEIQEMLLRLE